ncbi:MAG: late competence development ComFB family protein [Nitrospiraceae bacterium]|nr:late competence development ComFB family protein [Nitrospiraceae bacterium]
MAINKCTVINANYKRVILVMDKLLSERYQNACSCDRCMSDIAAIALNYLPPHYVVEEDDGRGEHGSPWVMVESAVSEAIDRVTDHPNHPPVTTSERKEAVPDRRIFTS